MKRILATAILVLMSLLFITSCTIPEVTSAKVYLQQDNPKAAEEILLKAIDMYGDQYPEVYWILGAQIYIPAKEWEKARDALNKYKKLAPHDAQNAEDQLKRVWGQIHTQGANLFNDALNAIMDAEKDSLLNEAVDKFQTALEIRKAPETYKAIVMTFFSQNDTDNVIQYSEEGIDNGVFDDKMMNFYLQVQWKPGNEENTLAKLDEIINSHPDSKELKMLQIQFLVDSKRYETALEKINVVLDEELSNIELQFIKAQILVELGMLEDAAMEFQKVLADNPDDPEVLIRIAQTYFKTKDYISSEDYSRRYIELKPDDRYGYDVLWKSLYNQGKKEEAEEYRQIEKSLR